MKGTTKKITAALLGSAALAATAILLLAPTEDTVSRARAPGGSIVPLSRPSAAAAPLVAVSSPQARAVPAATRPSAAPGAAPVKDVKDVAPRPSVAAPRVEFEVDDGQPAAPEPELEIDDLARMAARAR